MFLRLSFRCRRRLPFRAGLSPCQLSQPALLFSLDYLALRWRSAKPGTVGTRAVAREGGAQSGDLRAPLCGLPDKFALENQTGMARGHNLISQPHHSCG